MEYDYKKLKGKIVEVYGSQSNFAKKMGLSERTMSLKMSNLVFWKQTEISRACTLLKIKPEEIHEYFFKINVQYN